MPTATINPNMVEMNPFHLMPPLKKFKNEEEFADPLTPEEEKAVAIAEAQIARGECYIMHREESAEEFFARIDADPVGTKLCNTPGWKGQC